MRRIAALSTFLLLTGHSTLALADVMPERPTPEPTKSAETPTPEPTKSAETPTPEPTKSAETPTPTKSAEKSSCSSTDEDNGMLALAALALLLSGVALRRRHRSDVPSASA